jgi:cytochrome c oxidase cbb3-type subunit 4
MDSGTASGVMTAILIVVFLAIVAWAYSSRRRKDFEEAAHLPLEDGDDEHKTNEQG